MPLDEIEPGMVGVGITVFEGTLRENFNVEIIGVLRNASGPHRNLILVRLEGGPLAETGVIQGMSGSPVYIDDRLIGAVSFSFGSFAKEPIAGVTPIEEMISDGASLNSRRTNHNTRLSNPSAQKDLMSLIHQVFPSSLPFAKHASDIQALGLSTMAARHLGVLLRPIATPLVMTGFHPEIRTLLSSAFNTHGFTTLTGGSSSSPRLTSTEPLQPGDAVGVSLISGDLTMLGTGTVTLVEDNRLYAFGHSFYNLGTTQFPMTRAYVQTLLPSLATSSKIVTGGAVVGSFDQDRATVIAGTLGKSPTLIPIKLSLTSDNSRRTETFNFQVINDQLFTPLLTQMVILNTLFSYEREFGAITFIVKGKAIFKGHPDIIFDDVYTGGSPAARVAISAAAPLTVLLTNHFEALELEAIEMSITSIEELRTENLERVWLDKLRPRAGDILPLKLTTRTYRGEEVTRTLMIPIPTHTKGPLSLLVSDGVQLAERERRQLGDSSGPRNIQQMIDSLNERPRSNRLYVKLLSAEAGVLVSGERLSALPSSVLEIYETDRSSGSFIPLTSATLQEWELVTDHSVTGSRLITIDLESE